MGSSPRVRGKPWFRKSLCPRAGLIPACAGKTPTRDTAKRVPRAHPRVCGENTPPALRKSVKAGSSPRVRGKLLRHRRKRKKRGLIPACAGKTAWITGLDRDPKAHPRVCGENRSIAAKMSSVGGSSPRVRGKPRERGNVAARRGLIPACAGKTCGSFSAARPSRAHPRVCGENAFSENALTDGGGSSPRVRGKRVACGTARGRGGLIPACAGKTPSNTVIALQRAAHPRVCGENCSRVAR